MGKRLILPMMVGFGATVFADVLIQFCLAMTGKAIVAPGFAARFPNESAAILAQLGLIGLIGMAFAGGARVFELERWSLLKQGIVHFLITAAVWMPVVWLCWTPMPSYAVWISTLGWTVTYAINWIIQYFIWRRKVRELNRSICAYREVELHEGN